MSVKRGKLAKHGKLKSPAQPLQVPHFNRISEALLNQDILHLIFEHFDLQPGSPTTAQTRKDLLLAAKACKGQGLFSAGFELALAYYPLPFTTPFTAALSGS